MAIEVLRGKDYTYKYNLKLFFYILLWIYIYYSYDIRINELAKRKIKSITKNRL
jgi:hypothetical protein